MGTRKGPHFRVWRLLGVGGWGFSVGSWGSGVGSRTDKADGRCGGSDGVPRRNEAFEDGSGCGTGRDHLRGRRVAANGVGLTSFRVIGRRREST